VIDMDALTLHAPRMAYDLPAGGHRLVQGASGYRATIVNGVVTRRDGIDTGGAPVAWYAGRAKGQNVAFFYDPRRCRPALVLTGTPRATSSASSDFPPESGR
jgi:hypothetical protein